jgi:hypothetical protein
MKKGTIFIVLLFLTLLASAQIREIAVPTLPDIAMASYDQFGPVIYYNPIITQQVGPYVTEFFRAHEYGHHVLGHIQREFFDANPYNRAWVRQSYEREADCYAAKNASIFALRATIQFFALVLGPNRPDWYHPTGYERIAVIRNCGGF